MSELKRALAGSEKGVMATLVREAAAPLHEQEAEAEALREEVARQTARVAEVRRRRIALSPTTYTVISLDSVQCSRLNPPVSSQLL